MEILFNKNGTPVMMTSETAFVESVGREANKERGKRRGEIAPFDWKKLHTIVFDKYQVVSWGRGNAFPQKAAETIQGTSVLNTGLKFLRSLTIGQGIYPCSVTGFDEKGNEILSPIDDKDVNAEVNGRMIRRYLEKASRDYFKFGCSFTEMIRNYKGNIIGLQALNAQFCRYTMPDEYGMMKCVVSGDWPFNKTTDHKAFVYDVLPDVNPEAAFERMREGSGKSFIYPIRDSWSNDDIYGEPIWLPAYILGWIEIAHLVPKFLKKAYENQTTWKWHIQIPYSYWDKKYPPENFEDSKEREKKIKAWMDKIEQNLCGVENAEKPLFTNYAVNEANGKVEEEWKITALDNKYKGGENLVTSAAANSEILFALMVNPNVFGAGMPGGNYAGNQGGSNIREAFLVNIANAWIDRQNLLDPIQMFLKAKYGEDITLRFRNTVLTTLDTGAGTTKTLS